MKGEFNTLGVPIVVNMGFGHTHPKVILPFANSIFFIANCLSLGGVFALSYKKFN